MLFDESPGAAIGDLELLVQPPPTIESSSLCYTEQEI